MYCAPDVVREKLEVISPTTRPPLELGQQHPFENSSDQCLTINSSFATRGVAESVTIAVIDAEETKGVWTKFLSPETMRTNLLMVSLYLAAFEILKSTVTDRTENFFTFDDVNGQPQLHPKYQEVASLNKNPLQASLLWLKQNDAITSDDILMFDIIRQHRNELAHQLPHFLIDTSRNIDTQNFENIRYLLRKIETWWIQQVDIPSNSDYDGIEIRDEDIQPGSVTVLDAIIEMAFRSV